MGSSMHVVYYELFDKQLVAEYQSFLTAASFFEKKPSCSFLAMLCKNIWVRGGFIYCNLFGSHLEMGKDGLNLATLNMIFSVGLYLVLLPLYRVQH